MKIQCEAVRGHLYVADDYDVDEEVEIEVGYGDSLESVWLNREQLTLLRNHLNKLLGEV